MSLTSLEMKQLDEDARMMATTHCRGYLADALQCLRDTDDPIAPLELLRAMWNTGHAARREQKGSLLDAGHWLEDRLRREPALSPRRLELELGWLHRLLSVHRSSRNGRDRDSWVPPREPSFGAHIDALRRKREQALTRATAHPDPPRDEPPHDADTSRAIGPQPLPDSFEACFASWQEVVDAFKTARKRSRQQKQPKDRLLSIKPIRVELRPRATDLVCSMLNTLGMDELQARAVEGTGELPSFWISLADLIPHDGKRLATRISFHANRSTDDAPSGVRCR